MNIQDLLTRVRTIRVKYEQLETENYGRPWTGEELMLGFVKDVGDLAMLVQAKEGVRKHENVDEALAHELSDCSWSVIVLADKYGVDLEAAFAKNMDDLETRMHTQF